MFLCQTDTNFYMNWIQIFILQFPSFLHCQSRVRMCLSLEELFRQSSDTANTTTLQHLSLPLVRSKALLNSTSWKPTETSPLLDPASIFDCILVPCCTWQGKRRNMGILSINNYKSYKKTPLRDKTYHYRQVQDISVWTKTLSIDASPLYTIKNNT